MLLEDHLHQPLIKDSMPISVNKRPEVFKLTLVDSTRLSPIKTQTFKPPFLLSNRMGSPILVEPWPLSSHLSSSSKHSKQTLVDSSNLRLNSNLGTLTKRLLTKELKPISTT